MNHTLGPWQSVATKHRTLINSAEGRRVAECDSLNEADARLIAAAPMLLAALQELTDQYERLLVESRITKRDAGTMREMLPHYTGAARAAIRKATGETA